jgi:hypothetical protein
MMKGGFEMPKGIIYDEFSKENLEKKYGVKAVPGKLSPAKGKYALTYGGKRTTLDPNQIISDQPINKMVKEPVDVFVIPSPKGVIIIIIIIFGPKPPKPPRTILCYKPIPDLVRRIDKEMRITAMKALFEIGGIPGPLGKVLEEDILSGSMR